MKPRRPGPLSDLLSMLEEGAEYRWKTEESGGNHQTFLLFFQIKFLDANCNPENWGKALRGALVANHSFPFTKLKPTYAMPLFSKAIEWEVLIRGGNHGGIPFYWRRGKLQV